MENLSFKLEPGFAKDIERTMKRNKYMTKTEFIREAIRDKLIVLKEKEMLIHLEKIVGSSKKKTNNEKLHKARERSFAELEKKF